MNTNRSLVSIISPSLNSRQYLPRLLACLSQQTYQLVEHIIVDGQSTDGSQEFLKRVDPTSHRLIVHKDQSMYEAINRGIKASKGEILGYLNVDDLYFPTTLAIVVNCFAKQPLVDIVFGDVISIDEAKKHFSLYGYASHQYTASRLALDQSIGQPSVFFRRRVIDKIGLFDDHLKLVADLEYWMRAAAKKLKFKKINQFLSLDCRHEGMLRDERHRELTQELARVRDKYFKYPNWLRSFFSRRNYWEKMLIEKSLEYFTDRRFLPLLAGSLTIDLNLYRLARQGEKVNQPILTIDLPYFKFTGWRIDGINDVT